MAVDLDLSYKFKNTPGDTAGDWWQDIPHVTGDRPLSDESS
jgi:hypothetical protein